MSLLSEIAPPSGTGSTNGTTNNNNNIFTSFPPPVYSSPYHLFNIDDNPSKEVNATATAEQKMVFPPEEQFFSMANCCFDFNPEPSPNEASEPNRLLLNFADQLFSSSPMPSHPPPPAGATFGGDAPPQPDGPSAFLPFGSQASTPHNRRMIFPYTQKNQKSPGNKPTSTASSASSPPVHDEPLLLYRFFEFYCTNCEQCWLSPLFRAKNGCYCRICHHFILPRGIRHSFTPYLGKETCYGKYSCQLCNRGWSSYKSLSNRPDQCFECGTMVYPYYQIAHSVLFQKIHKNDDDLNAKSAFLKSFLSTKSTGSPDKDDISAGSGALAALAGRQLQQRSRKNSRHQNQHPRKITSISGLQSLSGVSAAGKQTVTSKKRLHCLNNVPFVRHSAQQVRRQFHLKNCFSEPTIVNNTRGLEIAELCKIQEK